MNIVEELVFLENKIYIRKGNKNEFLHLIYLIEFNHLYANLYRADLLDDYERHS